MRSDERDGLGCIRYSAFEEYMIYCDRPKSGEGDLHTVKNKVGIAKTFYIASATAVNPSSLQENLAYETRRCKTYPKCPLLKIEDRL